MRETCFTFIFRVKKSVWWAALKAHHFKALYLEFLTAHRTEYLTQPSRNSQSALLKTHNLSDSGTSHCTHKYCYSKPYNSRVPSEGQSQSNCVWLSNYAWLSAYQTIFMHPRTFYPMPKMIAHFRLPHSGIMLRAEPCRAMWVCTPVRFDQCLLEKYIKAKFLEQWSNQSHFIHIQLWLSKVKYLVRVAFWWFELEARLCPMGDEALVMRSLEL